MTRMNIRKILNWIPAVVFVLIAKQVSGRERIVGFAANVRLALRFPSVYVVFTQLTNVGSAGDTSHWLSR